MTSRDNFFHFGANEKHCAWTEASDIVHIEWKGDISAADIIAGARAFDLVPNREKGFYLLLHVAQQGQFPPEARKAISSDPRSAWVREVIMVGGTFHFRVLMTMVSKALHVLGISKARVHTAGAESVVAKEIERLRNKRSASAK